MINRIVSKYLPHIVVALVLGAIIKILLYIIYSIAELSEKGWKPALIFLSLVLLLVIASLVIVKRIIANSKKESDGTKTSPEKKPKPLIEIMEEQKNKEKPKVFDNHTVMPVYGSLHVGKTSLITCLVNSNTKSTDDELIIDVREMPSITANSEKNACILDNNRGNNLSLFVISEDMTNYEWDTLYGLIDSGSFVIIILNKTDILSKTQRNEIEESVKQKIQDIQKYNRCSFVQTAASPKPITVIIQSHDGTEKEEVRMPKEDCSSLLKAITYYVSKSSPSKQIKFMTTSR
jgi:hypothetical protein